MARDERVHEFLDRPLTGEWPYLWLDATYLKVRQGGRIISVAATIAVAANTDGRRESEPSRCHRFEPDGERPDRRPVRGRNVLGRVPAQPEDPRAERAEAGDLGRAYRPEGGDPARVRHHPAAMPGSLDAQRAGPCAQGSANRCFRRRSGKRSIGPTRKGLSRSGGTPPTSSADARPRRPERVIELADHQETANRTELGSAKLQPHPMVEIRPITPRGTRTL